jgi:hypothetical protein
MRFAKLFSDTCFSACGPARGAASDVTAWVAPAVVLDARVVLTAASQADARSDAPVGLVV